MPVGVSAISEGQAGCRKEEGQALDCRAWLSTEWASGDRILQTLTPTSPQVFFFFLKNPSSFYHFMSLF
jgi:hypothetical protein